MALSFSIGTDTTGLYILARIGAKYLVFTNDLNFLFSDIAWAADLYPFILQSLLDGPGMALSLLL